MLDFKMQSMNKQVSKYVILGEISTKELLIGYVIDCLFNYKNDNSARSIVLKPLIHNA